MKPLEFHRALLLLLLLLFPRDLFAATLELGADVKPIDVTADRLRAEGGGIIIFEGNVVAKQGNVTMFSNLLRTEYTKETNAIDKVHAVGDVRFIQEDKEVTSKKATLFNMEQRAVFTGEAVMRQGGNTVHGEIITVFINENRAVVQGSEGGGRVRAVIHPKDFKEPTKP